MKNGKLHKSGILKVLLGLVAAGALLFAACQNIFDLAEQQAQPKEDDGYGYVIVDLEDSLRTVRPEISDLTRIIYTFISEDLDLTVDYEKSSNSAAFRLPAGNYKLDVTAYTAANGGTFTPGTTTPGTGITNPLAISAKGKYQSGNGVFQVVAGKDTEIKVVLTPEANNATSTNTGTLKVDITFKAGLNQKAVYTLRQYLGSGQTIWQDIDISSKVNVSTYVLAINDPYTAGTYLLTGRINTDGALYGGFSEAIHIVPYMTTTVRKNFVDEPAASPNSYDVILSNITKPEEAIAILKDEIKSWITNSADVLASEIDTSVDGKIRINYLALKADGTTSTFTGTAFPIVLQGGWTPLGTAWNVGAKNALTTINLTNTSVKDNFDNAYNGGVATGAGAGTAATYIVELMPVAKYTVAWGTDDINTRSVLILPPGATSPVIATPGIGDGIGVAGSTAITINNAAITIDGIFASPDAVTGVYTLPAVSKPYDIQVYQDVNTQLRWAFNKLRAEIASGDTPWVVQKQALARIDPQSDSSSTSATPIPDYYGGFDTVTLYYVASRLDPTKRPIAGSNTFDITVPNTATDQRWDTSDWILTDNPYTNLGDTKRIGFKPYGGDKVNYIVKLIPVSEFYVNWADPTFTTTVSSTAKITINDVATTTLTNDFTYASNCGEFNTFTSANGATPYFGKRYQLGSTNIALSETAILLDIPTDDPANPNTDDLVVNTSDAVNSSLPTSNATRAIFAQFVTDDPGGANGWGVAGGTGVNLPDNSVVIGTGNGVTGIASAKAINAKSREYHIKVYRTITSQKTIAQTRIREETGSAPWVQSNGGSDVRGLESTDPTSTTSRILYVGTTEPTLKIRNDYNSTTGLGENFTAKGWTAITQGTGTTAGSDGYEAYGSRVVPLTFKAYGGYAESGVYNFRLIPAAKLTITYKKKPLSGDDVTGRITVQSSEHGVVVSTPSGYPTAVEYSGSVTDDNAVLVGIGAPILIDAPNGFTNKNIVATNYDSYATYGTTATIGSSTGPVLPTSRAYDIAVYPSIKDQQDDVFAGLKAVKKIADWDASSKIVDVKDVPATGTNAATDAYTGFQIVIDPTGTVTTIPNLGLPAGFLNADYTKTTPTPNNGINFDNTSSTMDGNGNKDVKLTFVPLGRTAATDDKDYTFKLTAVAQFDIFFMNGPTGIKATGDIEFNAYKPGTVGDVADKLDPTTDKMQVTHLDNPTSAPTTRYAGIGNFTVAATSPGGPASIKTNLTNVFSIDAATVDSGNTAITASTANATTKIFTATGLTSKKYTIRVYPTVAVQEALMLARLQAVNSNTGWWTITGGTGGTPPSPDLRSQLTRAVDSSNNPVNIAEVQYFGSVPATPTLPSTGFDLTNSFVQTGTGYNYVLTPSAFTSDTSAEAVAASASWQVSTFSFTAMGGSTKTNFYTFRAIPVAQYNVTYNDGSTGTVRISTPNTNNPVSPLTINSTMSAAERKGILGLGDTTIQITATSGQFTSVEIFDGDTRLKTLTPTDSIWTGHTAANNKTYEIKVNKIGQ